MIAMNKIITKIIKNTKNTPGPSSSKFSSSAYFSQILGTSLKDAQNSLKISSPR